MRSANAKSPSIESTGLEGVFSSGSEIERPLGSISALDSVMNVAALFGWTKME